MALREPREECLLRPRAVLFLRGELVGGVATQDAEVLRRQHELGARRRGLRDQRLRLREVRFDLLAGNHLDGRDAHQGGAPPGRDGAGTGAGAAAARADTRSTTGSDHEPRTEYS